MEKHRFRIFVSYASEDRPLAIKLVEALRILKLNAMCDMDIHLGTPFTDAIKGLISNAQYFCHADHNRELSKKTLGTSRDWFCYGAKHTGAPYCSEYIASRNDLAVASNLHKLRWLRFVSTDKPSQFRSNSSPSSTKGYIPILRLQTGPKRERS